MPWVWATAMLQIFGSARRRSVRKSAWIKEREWPITMLFLAKVCTTSNLSQLARQWDACYYPCRKLHSLSTLILCSMRIATFTITPTALEFFFPPFFLSMLGAQATSHQRARGPSRDISRLVSLTWCHTCKSLIVEASKWTTNRLRTFRSSRCSCILPRSSESRGRLQRQAGISSRIFSILLCRIHP